MSFWTYFLTLRRDGLFAVELFSKKSKKVDPQKKTPPGIFSNGLKEKTWGLLFGVVMAFGRSENFLGDDPPF